MFQKCNDIDCRTNRMVQPSKLSFVLLLWFSRCFRAAVKFSANHLTLHVVLVLVAIYLYQLSLAPCPRSADDKCIAWLFEENGLRYISFVLLLSSGLFAYLHVATILGIIPKLFYLVVILPSLIVVYNFGWRTSWKEHGGLNRLALVAIQLLALVLCFLWKVFDNLSKRCSIRYKIPVNKIKLLIVLAIAFLVLYNVTLWQNTGVKYFSGSAGINVGVNNGNFNSICKWINPRYYILDRLRGVFNFASLSSCRNSYVTEWIPEAVKSADVIGFHRLSGLSSRLLANMPALWKYIRDHVRSCSDLKNCTNVEQLLHISENPKFAVRVVRNETKVQTRLAISAASKRRDLKRPNVLILFVDALSRPAFRRQLPKTFALLRKWGRDHSFNVASFVKLSSFAAFTEPNLFPLMFGIDRETAAHRSQRANSYMRLEGLLETISLQSGYINGFAHTSCQPADFEWTSYLPLEMPRPDHSLIFCDPNFINVHDPFSPLKGPFSVLKRCMYGRQVHEYVLEYITSFWEVYRDMPKVFSAHFSEAHESTGEVIANIDRDLVSFLSKFISSGALNNTAFFLLSDHGNHMHPVLRLFPDAGWSQEEMHDPLLISITPSGVGNVNTIAHNQYQLVTMYDVRKTILSLTGSSDPITHEADDDGGWLERRRKRKVFDILNEMISSERNCQSAGVLPATCMCANTSN